MKRKKASKVQTPFEQVYDLLPVGGWISLNGGSLTISDGKKSHTAESYPELLRLIQLSPFSPSASRQTDQQPSASTEDSRDE